MEQPTSDPDRSDSGTRPTLRRRVAAGSGLFFTAALVALAVYDLVTAFPRGLVVVGALLLAIVTAAAGLIRTGIGRLLRLLASVLLIGLAMIAAFATHPLVSLLIVLCGILALLCIREAYRRRIVRAPAPRPSKPVVLINPRSGGGKAERFRLAEEARRRGIEPIEFGPGQRLETLAREAVARGADALAVAGGDGSQAIVAAIAAEHRLPFVCIPAGTRNHFALDLGVDREDVVGALDALVDGGTRWVDLAEVNGSIFVNNVSLGIYAEAVQQASYRQAKVRTVVEVAPSAAGLPSVLVSNNAYRLGARVGAGTRPSMEEGLLGIAVIDPGKRAPAGMPTVREWKAQEYVFEAAGPVHAAIDGEAVVLEGPLRFRAHPRALQVRIARAHPGVSPSASSPRSVLETPSTLLGIALGRG